MKKIRITEKQASLLGLKKIKEDDESGIKSVGVSIGEKVVRIVVSGENVSKFKDRIIQLIARQDKDARVGFFYQTGKIVGNVKDIRVDSIKRDIKALDPTINVEVKPMAKSLKEGKNIIKISKTQYDRLFSSKLITEGEDVTKKEDDNEDQIKKEVIELIKYLYRKSEKLSPFWAQNGMDYDNICDTLLAKKIIVKNGGRYELAKSLGNPQQAIQAVEDTLRTHIKPQIEIPSEPELETEDSGYPAGAEHSSEAPYNEKDNVILPNKPKHPKLEIIAFGEEIAIFKGIDGSLYVFYYYGLGEKDLKQYFPVTRRHVGSDDEGNPDFDYEYGDTTINAEVIEHYVNDNLQTLSKGEGLDAYESGSELVKIDDSLKQELLGLYDKDKNIANALNPIDEVSQPEAIDSFKDSVKQNFTPNNKPKPAQHVIVAKLAELKAKEVARRKAAGEVDEMTGTGSAGAFTGPMTSNVVKKEMPVPIVGETTVAGDFQYDTPGGLTMDLGKSNPKTKAEKTTQWAGGSFVKQPDCSKANNNKSAQNGGCNSGSSSLKTIKTGGSINAPSLGENIISKNIIDKLNYMGIAYMNYVKFKSKYPNADNNDYDKYLSKVAIDWKLPVNENEIYETIAKQTGKTLDEVKRIIDLKKNKA